MLRTSDETCIPNRLCSKSKSLSEVFFGFDIHVPGGGTYLENKCVDNNRWPGKRSVTIPNVTSRYR